MRAVSPPSSIKWRAYLGKVDAVLGIESRGFIFGAPVAYRLGVGLAIARKPGKLPPYLRGILRTGIRQRELQMHQDASSAKPGC